MIGYLLAVSTNERKSRSEIIHCNPDSRKDELKCLVHCQLEGHTFGTCEPFFEPHICVCFN
jgi:hypothetical protein